MYGGPLVKAINRTMISIPRQILDTVFIYKSSAYNTAPSSLEDRIMENVITPFVLPELNISYGRSQQIPLIHCTLIEQGLDYKVVHIPLHLTDGSKIVTAVKLSTIFPQHQHGHYVSPWATGNIAVDAAQGMLNNINPGPAPAHAKIKIIGDNVLLIRHGYSFNLGQEAVHVLTEHDTEMTSVQPHSYDTIGEMVVLAVKAYIYNEYVITMGDIEMRSGRGLAIFKDIIDGYSDSLELFYTTKTEKYQKVMFMNDEQAFSDHVKNLFPGA